MDANWPISMGDLSEEEHFLVWSIRRVLTGQRAGQTLTREFRKRFGADSSGEGLELLEAFLYWIGLSCRRPVRFYPPCCSAVGADEIVLVRLIVAERQGDRSLLDSLAHWFLEQEFKQRVIIHTDNLVEFLSEHGFGLPQDTPINSYFPAATAGATPVFDVIETSAQQ